MRKIILLIILLIFSVWLGHRIAMDPGVVILAWQDLSIEMPFWFAALCLMLLVFVCWQLARLIGTIRFSAYRFQKWRETRQLRKALKNANTQALCHAAFEKNPE